MYFHRQKINFFGHTQVLCYHLLIDFLNLLFLKVHYKKGIFSLG
jgi:hypothetical protein